MGSVLCLLWLRYACDAPYMEVVLIAHRRIAPLEGIAVAARDEEEEVHAERERVQLVLSLSFVGREEGKVEGGHEADTVIDDARVLIEGRPEVVLRQRNAIERGVRVRSVLPLLRLQVSYALVCMQVWSADQLWTIVLCLV